MANAFPPLAFGSNVAVPSGSGLRRSLGLRSTLVRTLCGAFAAYLVLWTLMLFGAIDRTTYAVGNTVSQVFFEVFAAWSFLRTAQRLSGFRRTTFRWFGTAAAALAISDGFYGVLVNTLAVPGIAGSLRELWYTIPYGVFWAFSVAAFATVLHTFPRILQQLAWSFTGLVAIVLFLGVYVEPLSRDALPLPCKLVYVVCVSAKCASIALAGFALAFSSHRGLRRVSGAWLALACYCFLSEYLEMNGAMMPISLAEIVWTLGGFALALGSTDSSWWNRKPWADVRSIRPVIFLAFAAMGGAGLMVPEVLRRIAAALHWPVPTVGIALSGAAVLVVLAAWASRMGRQLLHEFVLAEASDASSPGWTAREFAVLRHTRSRAARVRRLMLQFCHDVRSPLMALRAGCEGLKAHGGESAELVVLAAERFAQLSDDFLARARTSPAVLSDEPSVPLQVEVACENFLSAQPHFRDGFGLLLDPALEDLAPKVDAWGVSLLVGNLLMNCADAARERSTGKRVRVRGHRLANGAAQIDIEDDCGGFAPGVLTRLRRGERLTTKSQGNGLGLSGWTAQLREVGGTIAFENDGFDGRGARVTVTIPSRAAGR